ncbi:PAS domain-containing protein [Phenylobacterium sp.]|uniref:PAS domain-containing protein n=1 Tax=Phenylobacterium sp. TaxID=1871053 RepID=UPI002F425C2A
MLKKLGRIELFRRPDAAGPGRLLQVGVAVTLLAVAGLLQVLVDKLSPGVTPFALLFPAVLVATLIAGWECGAMVTGLGGLFGWTMAMHHPLIFPRLGTPATPADAVDLGLYLVSAAAIIVLAEAQRRSAGSLAKESARRLDARERMLAEQRELFEHTRGFMALVSGPDYVFEFANESYRRLVGGRNVDGLPLMQALPEFPDSLVALLDDVRANGRPHVGKAVSVAFQRKRREPPEERFLDFVLQPIRDPDGKVDRVFLEGVDVTDAVRSQTALMESEARLWLATTAAGMGVFEWRIKTNKMIFSDQAKTICGFPLGKPVNHEMMLSVLHPEEREAAVMQVYSALDPAQRQSAHGEHRIITPQGEERWVAANGQALFEEIDGIASANRYVGTLQDITARKTAEAEMATAMRRLRLVSEAGGMAVWQVHPKHGFVHGPELNAIFGLPPDTQLTDDDMRGFYMPGELDRIRSITYPAFARGERKMELEYRVRRADGAVRWIMTRGEMAANAEGLPRGSIGVMMDITDRKDSEERMKLLAREVDHRANNLLAVVQGTIQLSQAPSPEALRKVLSGRISALGRAHQLLSEARWEGADLRRLVEEELLAFSLGAASRVSIRGKPVALPPAAAQALAMSLHELATNAAKYGALSTPQGHVAVSWARDAQGLLTIRWVESKGPLVTPPTRRGLGTNMLARALSGALKGETRMDWRPTGLICELKLPAETVPQT